jgi:hypothetical protein
VESEDEVDFDVTSVVWGDGVYCVALDTLSGDGVDSLAREARRGGPALTVALATACTCEEDGRGASPRLHPRATLST